MIDIRGWGCGVRGGIVWAISVVVSVGIHHVFPGLGAWRTLRNHRLLSVVVWRRVVRCIQN